MIFSSNPSKIAASFPDLLQYVLSLGIISCIFIFGYCVSPEIQTRDALLVVTYSFAVGGFLLFILFISAFIFISLLLNLYYRFKGRQFTEKTSESAVPVAFLASMVGFGYVTLLLFLKFLQPSDAYAALIISTFIWSFLLSIDLLILSRTN